MNIHLGARWWATGQSNVKPFESVLTQRRPFCAPAWWWGKWNGPNTGAIHLPPRFISMIGEWKKDIKFVTGWEGKRRVCMAVMYNPYWHSISYKSICWTLQYVHKASGECCRIRVNTNNTHINQDITKEASVRPNMPSKCKAMIEMWLSM